MRRIIKKIILIVLIILSINLFLKTYANYETEELISMLDEIKSEFGDMRQFKEVIDAIYNDLNSANKVDDTLKAKLKEDIKKLAQVEGINPMVSTILIDELEGQVDSLTDETLPEMKEEIVAIKEWADKNQDDSGEEPKPQTPSDPSISNKDFPYAGIRNFVYGVVLIAMLIFAIIAKKKYKKLNDI